VDANPPVDSAIEDSGDACTTSPCTVFLSANGDHTCATMSDGTVRCWGDLSFGAGGALAEAGAVPVVVPGLGPVKQAKLAVHSACALLQDESVWCWGDDVNGILGFDAGVLADGAALQESTAPVLVLDAGSTTSLAVGGFHACALVASPAGAGGPHVVCWGQNDLGQVGLSDAAIVTTPHDVPITEVTGISASLYDTCFFRSAAPVDECIGGNAWGQLGRGDGSIDTTPNPTPAAVQLGAWGAIETLTHSSGYHQAIILASGDFAMWGANNLGQLGLGPSSDASVPTPQLLQTLTGVTDMSLTEYGTCALRIDGTVWCWGSNAFGQTGPEAGTGVEQPLPVQVPGITNAVRLAAGYNHVCAQLAGGSVVCWGANGDGQLGRKTTVSFDPNPGPVAF
jgi:alpha-tubulin suppressor-like RCC1 family protein